VALVGLLFLAPVVSPRGVTRAGIRVSGRFTDMFELPTQRYGGTPKRQRARKEGRAILHPISLGRLTRGVDLLLGYVDLRYGSSFEELAHLSRPTH
jgi:hypothetical protein